MYFVSPAEGTSLAQAVQSGYSGIMSMLLRQLARYVAQKAASDPRAKEIALRAAQGAVDEAKHIARQDDKAYAAGRAVRQALKRMQNDR